MTTDNDSIFWPIRGFTFFLLRPQLWLGPILATIIAWLITFAVACLILYFTWPDETTDGFWNTSLSAISAIAYASVGLVAMWVLAMPFLLSIAYERLVLHIFKTNNIEQENNEHFIASIGSSLLILIHGLPWRLFWLTLGMCCSIIFPPAAIIATAVGLGHISLLDATDLVLSVKGKSGKQRRAFFKQYRRALLSAGLVAGIISALLSFSVIGLLFWLPGITCSAALCLPHWIIDEQD